MSKIQTLFEMDGWRKFAVVVLAYMLSFVLVLFSKMTGDAFGFLAGSLGSAFIAGEVGGYAVKTKAANNQQSEVAHG